MADKNQMPSSIDDIDIDAADMDEVLIEEEAPAPFQQKPAAKHEHKAAPESVSKNFHPHHAAKKHHPQHHAHKGTPAVQVFKAKHHAVHAGKKPWHAYFQTIAIVVLALAVIALLLFIILKDRTGPAAPGTTTGDAPTAATGVTVDPQVTASMKALAGESPYLGAKDAPVVIVEFSDFQCPYCTKFWKDTLPSIKKNFVETGVVKFVYRDLPLSFHADAQKAAEASQCAHEQGKYWEYHDALFTNQAKLDVDSLKKYALDLGLDVAEFSSCLDSGKTAAKVAAGAAAAQSQGISGTPGFVINGQKISGALPYADFEREICKAAPQSEPCKNVKPPVAFTVTVLVDQRCGASCDAASIKARTTQLFPGATYKDVDASTTEGKALVAKYQLTMAPVFIFPETVTTTDTWTTQPSLQSFFDKTADGYKLKDTAIGATWLLSDEARAAQAAKLGELLGMKTGDNKPQIDFFVMSYCPYGNQAEEAIKPVYDALKGQAIFNPRYVIYTQGTGCYEDTDGTQLCSLHGAVELNQNIRELCVFKQDGEGAWFDFAIAMNSKCDGTNADTCWTAVAKDLGLDTTAIQSCFDKNKVAYAREEYELNALLGVSGSPTIYVEGQKSDARSSNAYLAALCDGFTTKPAACDAVLEETTAAVSGNC